MIRGKSGAVWMRSVPSRKYFDRNIHHICKFSPGGEKPMENVVWLLVVGGGAAILGLALAYAMMKNRKLTPEERKMQAEQTRGMYENDD
jgi:hypothetical protein